jgi:sulfonate transport system permease protein
MSSLPIHHAARLNALAAGAAVHGARRAALPAWTRRAALLLTGLLFPLLLVGVWSLAARYELVSAQILPEPSLVLDTAVDLVDSGQLQAELAVSFVRLAAGLFIGGTLGLVVGIAMGLSRTVEAYLGPTVRAICLVPSLGWLPFFMIVFGIGETLKFVLIAKTCFLPLMINSHDGVRNVPRKYRDVARVLELGSWGTLRYVVLPSMLPAIFTGFRQALSKGWKALILVEMIASAAGIGYLMTWGRKAFQLDVVLVTMIVVGLAGWVIDRGSLALQKRFTAWSFKTAQ